MSPLDIKKNVDSRAAALLEHHMSLLGASPGFSRKDELTYAREGGTDLTDFLIGYDVKSKFMTKTYNLLFKARIPNMDLGDSFKARIKFRGVKTIETGFFEIKPKREEAERLLNDPALIDLIVNAAREVDIAMITVEYSAGTEALTISILPYAGAFLWIKLPPVYYPLKLNEIEMNALEKLSREITGRLSSFGRSLIGQRRPRS
jgi:hypothetical protein